MNVNNDDRPTFVIALPAGPREQFHVGRLATQLPPAVLSDDLSIIHMLTVDTSNVFVEYPLRVGLMTKVTYVVRWGRLHRA